MNLLLISSDDARLANLRSLFQSGGYPPMTMSEEDALNAPSYAPVDLIVYDGSKYAHETLSVIRETAPGARIMLVNDAMSCDTTDSIQLAAYMAAANGSKLFDASGSAKYPNELLEKLAKVVATRAAA